MFFESSFEYAISRIFAKYPVSVRLKLWNGRRIDLAPSPAVTIIVPKASALRYFISPDLNKLGEAFVEGHIRVEGSIHEVFRVAEALARSVATTTRSSFHYITRHSLKRDRKAIEYHYDVSNDFYSLFLDQKMVYSCAYYRSDNDSLEKAQEQKLDHILTKLIVTPGERFLDIGCGWGALIIRAAKKYGAIATGVTLSENQFEYVRKLIRTEGLQDRCTVELRDYRDLSGTEVYDKIASVGMFEHVGLKNLPEYFLKIRSLLRDKGLMLNHGITTSDTENRWMGLGAGDFIDRYVFPSGELPHISVVIKNMSRAGLEVFDVESLRRHYARTCHEWASRLESVRERASILVGEKRLRIWQIYLAGCAFGFTNSWMNIYQILSSNAKANADNPLPLTRDYIYS